MRDRLAADGVSAYPKTSGKKGMQLCCPISGTQDSETVSAYAKKVAEELSAQVPRSITAGTAPGSVGCTYYEASLRELLLMLIGSIGPVEHVRCTGRGEGSCEWRADWRTFDRTAGLE